MDNINMQLYPPSDQTTETVQEAVDSLNREVETYLYSDPQISLEKAREAEKVARSCSSEAQYTLGLMWSIVNQARALSALSQFESALKLALSVQTWPRDTPERVACHNMALYVVAGVYEELGDFPKAQAHYHDILSFAESANDLRLLLFVHNNLALIYSASKNYEMAIEHLEIAGNLLETQHIPNVQIKVSKSLTRHNTGEVYILDGQVEKGLDLVFDALALCDQAEAPDLYVLFLSTIAKGYQILQKMEEAQTFYKRALNAVQSTSHVLLHSEIRYRYGEVLYEQGQYDEAQTVLDEALQLATDRKGLLHMYRSHELLSKVAEAKQRFDVALYHHKQFHALQYQVQGEESAEKLRHLRVSYEVDVAQKEAEIYRLRTEELEELVEKRTTEVLQALEQSEKANNVRANILKTIMHEFRTPLTVISSSSSLLKKHSAKMSPEKQAQMYTRIADSIQYLSKLLDEVSKVENSSTGTLAPSYTSVVVGQWSEKLANHLRRETADPVNVTYVFDAADETIIEIDTEMTTTIVLELLMNAIKYTPDEKPITVERGVDGEHVVVTVADEGMGIVGNELDKIYELFYRAYKAGDIPGLGTGLYVVKSIVDRLGGTIEVVSAGDSLGTTFTVKLPL